MREFYRVQQVVEEGQHNSRKAVYSIESSNLGMFNNNESEITVVTGGSTLKCEDGNVCLSITISRRCFKHKISLFLLDN